MAENIQNICAVCFDKLGLNSKKRKKITPAVEELIKIYIWDMYGSSFSIYPKAICSNCRRNLFSMDKGETSHLTNWINKISQVSMNIKM